MCVCMYTTCASCICRCLKRPKKGVTPGDGVTNSYEPPSIDAGNQTEILIPEPSFQALAQALKMEHYLLKAACSSITVKEKPSLTLVGNGS